MHSSRLKIMNDQTIDQLLAIWRNQYVLALLFTAHDSYRFRAIFVYSENDKSVEQD